MLEPVVYTQYQYLTAEKADSVFTQALESAVHKFEKTAPKTEANENLILECERIFKRNTHKTPLSYEKGDRMFEACGISLPEVLELCNIEKPKPCDRWEELLAAMNRLDAKQLERLNQYEQLWIQPWFGGPGIDALQPSQKILGYCKCLLRYREGPAPVTERQEEALQKMMKWSVRSGPLLLSLQEICDLCELYSLPLRWVLGIPNRRLLYTRSEELEKALERYMIMTPTGKQYVMESLLSYEN